MHNINFTLVGIPNPWKWTSNLMEDVGVVQLTSSTSTNANFENIGIFKVIFKKKQYDISFDLNSTISQLKEYLHTIIGTP